MLSSAKRRMSALERSIHLPITADRFLARVEEVIRLTGASSDEAFRLQMAPLSEHELEHLIEEFLERACGDDMEARNEVMRKADIRAASTDS
jgi:hypothetical protein